MRGEFKKYLTPREWQIACAVAESKTNARIARELGLTEGTVKVYLTKLYAKFQLNGRVELAVYMYKKLAA